MSFAARFRSQSNASRKRKTSKQTTPFSTDIHHYELLSAIGVDDTSYIYLSRYLPTQELVALKYTDLRITSDYEFIEELVKAELNTRLCEHPNVLPHFVSFVENERLWTVTVPMKAGSAKSVLSDFVPDGFPEPIVATILREAIKGLAYLHGSQMVHGDIRADNILMDTTGEIRLSGLNYSINLMHEGRLRKAVFQFVGNAEWMAPEIIAQDCEHGKEADIYSVGVTAIELLYGKTPFDQWPALKILLNKLQYDFPRVPSDKKMSRLFHDMVSLCLSKDPRKRPTASKLLEHPFLKLARSQQHVEQYLEKLMGPHVIVNDDSQQQQQLQQQQQQSQQQYQQQYQQEQQELGGEDAQAMAAQAQGLSVPAGTAEGSSPSQPYMAEWD